MNRFQKHFRALLTLGLIVLALPAWAADKNALLIGVTKYEHSGMSALKYPEDDAKALGELLQSGGYEVELLLGKDATQKAIGERLEILRKKGSADGVIVLGLFGHGVEVETLDGTEVVKDQCFCPFDTDLRQVLDSKGKPAFDKNRQPQVEPDPATLVKLADIMAKFKLAKSGHRVVLADCCRVVPNQARGRSFGSGFKATDLPENTAILFGCSPGEQAFEHADWGHGAFTKSLLEQMPLMANQGDVTTGTLGDRLKKHVPQLVKTVSARDSQTPIEFHTDSVDLQLVLKQEIGKLLINTIGMKLTLIPAGEFRMGSTDADIDAVLKLDASLKKEQFADEQPQHRVRITKPYYLGVHEVTKGQFAAFVKAKNYQTDAEKDGKGGYGLNDKGQYEQKPEYTWRNAGFPQTDDHPVVNVSWNDAVAFCEWLSAKEGQKYQLPSEAQWEYACRAGTTSLWWHGAAPEGLAKIGNVADGTAKEKFSSWSTITAKDGYVFTAPVGRFRENAFGLYDMHGNAFEWCQDGYDAEVYAARSGVTSDPLNAGTVDRRVLRGGSWGSFARYSRSASRGGYSPGIRDYDSGFRISRTQ